MALDLIAELASVLDALAAASVPYALCGGLALAIHGHPRATLDIDVLLPADQLAPALAAARGCGFDVPARKMVFGLRAGTPREVHRVSKLDRATNVLLSLDLLVVNAELEAVWNERVTVDWQGREIAIVSREGLATMKRIAGRPQDLADLAALEGHDDGDEDS